MVTLFVRGDYVHRTWLLTAFVFISLVVLSRFTLLCSHNISVTVRTTSQGIQFLLGTSRHSFWVARNFVYKTNRTILFRAVLIRMQSLFFKKIIWWAQNLLMYRKLRVLILKVLVSTSERGRETLNYLSEMIRTHHLHSEKKVFEVRFLHLLWKREISDNIFLLPKL